MNASPRVDMLSIINSPAAICEPGPQLEVLALHEALVKKSRINECLAARNHCRSDHSALAKHQALKRGRAFRRISVHRGHAFFGGFAKNYRIAIHEIERRIALQKLPHLR